MPEDAVRSPRLAGFLEVDHDLRGVHPDHSRLDTLYGMPFDLMSAQPDQMLIRPDYVPPCDRNTIVNKGFLS